MRLSGWIPPAAGAVLVVGAVLVLPPITAPAAWQQAFATVAISLVMQAMPFILLGALLGGIVEAVLPDGALPRWVARAGPAALPLAAAAGTLLPTCECAVVGVARGLVRKGLPAHLAVAWMLAAPAVSPTVFASTWTAFHDPVPAALRWFGGLFVAGAVGFAVQRLAGDRWLRAGVAPQRISLAGGVRWTPVVAGPVDAVRAPLPARRSRWGDVLPHAADHLTAMLAPFVFGCLVAAALKTWVPLSLAGLMADPWLAAAGMMGAAVLLSLCAEADAFVCISIPGAPLHAQTGFLVLGPMLDLKLLLLWRGLLTDRAILIVAGLAVLGVAAWVGVVALGTLP